jgi:diguanylate cyclase (GGDEF)-like protein
MGKPHDQTRAAVSVQRFRDTVGWMRNETLEWGVGILILSLLAGRDYGHRPVLVLLPATVLCVVGATVLDPRAPDSTGYVIGQLAWLVTLGAAVPMTGGAQSYLLPWMAIVPLVAFTRLDPRDARRMTIAAVVLTSAPLLIVDFDGVLDSPWLLLTCVVACRHVTLLGTAMSVAELTHRQNSVLDQLTGLLNRRTLDERFDQLRDQATVMADDVPLAVIVCDIDHFKAVNDVHGHDRGDDALRDVAYQLRKSLRRFELAYRMGGEEFLVLLPNLDAAAAVKLAEELRERIKASRPGGLPVTISLGVAVAPARSFDRAQLLAAADRALYAAKAGGRDRTVLADPSPLGSPEYRRH